MQQLREHRLSLLMVAILIAGSVGWYKWPFTTSAAEASLEVPVKQGTFKILVTTTGELRASKFIQITGPARAQDASVGQTKIASIVPEGTIVKTGDIIAQLDRAPIVARMTDEMRNLQAAQVAVTKAELDSALNLAQAREGVRTAEDALEEKQLLKEQAQYEAPAIKRQAEIDYEKAQRALAQSKSDLGIKTRQAITQMTSVNADLSREQDQLKKLRDLMETFAIKAPAPGMVIYLREWDGTKKGVDSRWSPWDPAVAMLPDLTQMESDTYVNEVDIRKIALGQKVQVTLDADPNKKFDGIVTQIANVGEQRPNQDSKVFEVHIKVVKPDTTLRPGMTTANSIETASISNVLSVPLESVINEGGFAYVYKKDGRTSIKQMIETGAANDNEIVVRRGLTKDDRVMLSVPADKAGIKTESLPGRQPVVMP